MSPLSGFILRVVLWLPLCFAAWYFLSILFVIPLGAALDLFMTWLFPSVVKQVGPHGNSLVVVTALTTDLETAKGMGIGNLTFELNPLIYGYCVPLYTGLLIASPGSYENQLLQWIGGMLVLYFVQIFGISADILKTIAFYLGPQARSLLGYPPWGYEVIALAYQLGYLILPAVMPLAIWFSQSRDFIATLSVRNPPAREQP